MHHQMLDKWPESQRRKEGQRTDDNHDPHQKAHKERAVSRERATRGGHLLFGGQASGNSQVRAR